MNKNRIFILIMKNRGHFMRNIIQMNINVMYRKAENIAFL